MDDQLAVDPVVKIMEKESDLAVPTKPNKLLLKLKFRKNNSQHICPFCTKEFDSGKALGGHIRIHMKGNRKISKLKQPRNIHRKKRIPVKNNRVVVADTTDLSLIDEEGNEKEEEVSCCICNKGFRSMKSLFGHMRKHPERAWRGIRPPPSSDKNSCCSSSVSEDDGKAQALSCATEKGSGSDSDPLLKSILPKRCGKFSSSDEDDDEIPEAAYCLMKLARGDSFDLGQSFSKYSSTDRGLNNVDKTQSWDSEMGDQRKGKGKLEIEWDQERVVIPSEYTPDEDEDEEKKMVKLLGKTNKKKKKRGNILKVMNYADHEDKIIQKNLWFDQFQKFPTMIPDDQVVQMSTHKVLDFDLNEPYKALDDEAIAGT